MGNSKKDRLTNLIKKLHDSKMLSNPVVKALVDRAIATGDSDPLYEHLENFPVIEAIGESNERISEYQKLDNPFPYPDRDDVQEFLSGPLKLGYVNLQDDMFGLEYNLLCLPVLIPGRVGSGKSHLLIYILIQLLRKKRDFNVIIPDLKGKEYRHLLSCCKNLKVLNSRNINMNLLQVPKWMTPSEYIVFFADVFSKENFMLETSKGIIIKNLEEIFQKRGIFNGSEDWPTIHDLYNAICYELEKQKSFHFRDVLLNLQIRLFPYIFSEHFNCRTGIPHDIWRTENIVIELGKGFTDNMYSFLIAYIAGLRYTYNIEMGLLGSKLRTLFVVDEGRILFRPRNVESFGEGYITTLSTRFRDPGLGIVIASHETSSFNQTIRAIAFTKICFPLTEGEDVEAIKKSFGLTNEQAEHLFCLPRHGQAIVRYGGYKNPFVLGVPFLNLKKRVTDEEVEQKMANFYSELQKSIQGVGTSSKPKKFMPVYAATLLNALSKKPFTKISDMPSVSGLSSSEVKKSIHWLEKNELIQQQAYKTSLHGRKSIFAVLTPKAFEYMGVKPTSGRGGYEHKLFQHLISQNLKSKGLKTVIEGRMKGSQKAIDVLSLSEDGNYLAFEVTSHFENLSSNIIQDFDSGVSKVHIVTRSKSDMEKAIQIVKDDPSLAQYGDRIVFSLISEFFS